jgi:ATP-dependent helicase/nuclease subunit A
VPQPYIAQLSLYRALLSRLYPKKLVLAALVFTSGLRLIEVPGSAADAALAQVLAETHSPVNVP